MYSMHIFRQTSSVRLPIKQCSIQLTKCKYSDSKDDLKEKIKMKTPIGKLDELKAGKHPFQEKEPLKEWPEGRNPTTGEQNGPKGPEPTRYGDWERKGRVTDF
ncbi:PREDICTED: succinate dehydrogenase assembly factor 4, mitochondrial-like [Diuraphis noxia]|uniref:succinate dehydrogenase assembly factor 4, mitochondrial-like n=1 Tax=Diuraphis noxia TaxID=143948 RepID=UPI0007635730|nr:PREDICTED: succinate dehydrogenase assembly factor 4, mitochondrial-like [Diuraphis noxia]